MSQCPEHFPCIEFYAFIGIRGNIITSFFLRLRLRLCLRKKKVFIFFLELKGLAGPYSIPYSVVGNGRPYKLRAGLIPIASLTRPGLPFSLSVALSVPLAYAALPLLF